MRRSPQNAQDKEVGSMPFKKTGAFKDRAAPSNEVGQYAGQRWEYRRAT